MKSVLLLAAGVLFMLLGTAVPSTAEEDLERFLTEIISDDNVSGQPDSFKYMNGEFIAEPNIEVLENNKALQGTVDFEKVRDLDWREKDFSLARRVGMFDIVGDYWGCSGFLVGPDLFLTNHHCVYNDEKNEVYPVRKYIVRMDYTDNKESTVVTSRVTAIVKKNRRLDYALLRLEKPLGTELGWLKLGRTSEQELDAVKIIQHPLCRTKEISRKNSHIVANYRERDRVLHYLADTEPGSSGSPVFALKDESVIALHHAGIRGYYNEGIRMDRILPDIAQYLWPEGSQ